MKYNNTTNRKDGYKLINQFNGLYIVLDKEGYDSIGQEVTYKEAIQHIKELKEFLANNI
jgi:hypothetical protein